MASTSGPSEVPGSSSMADAPSTSTEEDEQKVVDGQTQFELLLAIERFLEGGRFGRAAAALRQEINEKRLVPTRTDINGDNHDQNYRQYLSALSHLPSTSTLPSMDTLPTMISRLSTLSDRAVPPPVKGLKLRLITNKRSAVQRTNEVLLPPRRPNLLHGNRGHVPLTLKTKHSPIELLRAREMGSRVPPSLLPGPSSLDSYERHYRIQCHLGSSFCVIFDKTENYCLTGSDDNLIKVFNVDHGLLKFTYRGHASEIADMAVSHCNQLVASASVDKVVRVWKLQNGETIAVLKHHTAQVTCLRFLPFVENGDMRYLVTSGNDCIINFHVYNERTLEFPSGSEGLAYHRYERDQPGAKMVSLCYSESGHHVISGESHGLIRIYRVHGNGCVEKTHDIVAHSDRVDSLMFAHSGLRFASGAKDGLVKIWQYQYGEWNHTVLALSQEELVMLCGVNALQNNPNSKNRYKISMVCWTRDDARLITTGSDYSFRVWDVASGRQQHKIVFHTADIYHVLPHPVHANIIFSAGHDGRLVIWDVARGVILKHFHCQYEREDCNLYDMALAKNGTRVALVDGKGFFYVFGLGTNKRKFLKDQYLQYDYLHILLDDAGYAMDVNTGIAPHLLNPRLVDTHLAPYPMEIQAMVHSRDYADNDSDAALIPPWLEVDIAPKLPANELKYWTSRQLALSAAEVDEYERERARERSATPSPIVPLAKKANPRRLATNFRAVAETAAAQAQRSENARARAMQARQMALIRHRMSLRYLGVNPDDEDGDGGIAAMMEAPIGSDDEEAEGTQSGIESETDTSDTDYENDDERRTRQRERAEAEGMAYSSQGTASRPRRREREVEPMDEDEDEMEESSQQSRPSRRSAGRGRRSRPVGRTLDDFGDDLSIDMNESMQPYSSSGRRRGRATRRDTPDVAAERTEARERPSGSRSRRVRRTSEREDQEMGSAEPEEDTVVEVERMAVRRQPRPSRPNQDAWKFSFPDWMREVKRKRFPYVAQPGDHVVYFRQGHEHYMNTVETTKLYRIDPRMVPGADIGMEEFAVVEDVKYVLKPYRLTQLKLAKTDSDGRRTGGTWTVKHHDMDNVPDFLILRAFYEEGLAMGLEVGDEIEAAIDDQWWTGTVESTNRNDSYPDAHWQSVSVRWAAGEDDSLSIWDLRKLTTRRGPGQHPVSEEEMSTLGAVPYIEWAEGDDQGDATRRRMKRVLEMVATCETLKEFTAPVPLSLFTDYPSIVAYPMDLRTICERIENQYYRRLSALLQDVRYVALSAEAYNERGSVIVRNAKVLVEAVVKLANDPSITDFVAFYDSCHDIPDAELLEYKRRPRPTVNSEMLDLLREADNARVNGNADGAGGAPSRPGWIRDAVEILEELMQQTCARHFKIKDDENEDLATVWETCEDLQTLCGRVRACELATPKEIETAVHSLVSSVKNATERRSELYKHAVELLSLFNARIRNVLSKFESVQASIQLQLGVSIDRSLRRRKKDAAPQHAYNTRRSDYSALTAAALAVHDEEQEEQPTTSTSRRSAASHEMGYYRRIANGGRARDGSQETEASSSSSRGRMSMTTGRRSARRGGEMEEEPPQEQPSSSSSQRTSRGSQRRSVVVKEEEEEEEQEEEEEMEAAEEEGEDEVEAVDEDNEEAMQEYEAPADDEEVEVNPEVKQEEEEEEEEDEYEDSDDEEYEEETTSRARTGRRGASKRRVESTEEEEAASTSTASSSTTRRSGRVRKRRRLSSGEEEEEEDEDEVVVRRSRGGGGRAVRQSAGGGRPTRNTRMTTYDERTDEDEEERRMVASVSQRGRQRRVRTFAD